MKKNNMYFEHQTIVWPDQLSNQPSKPAYYIVDWRISCTVWQSMLSCDWLFALELFRVDTKDSWLKSSVILFTTNKPCCSLLRLFSQNCGNYFCWHLYLASNEHCSIHLSVFFSYLPTWSTQDRICFHSKSGFQSEDSNQVG